MEPVDVQHLETGKAYIVSRETPLMPIRFPANVSELLCAVSERGIIPKGGRFIVSETDRSDAAPWYRVTAWDRESTELGVGWINSAALLGQSLVCEEKGERDHA